MKAGPKRGGPKKKIISFDSCHPLFVTRHSHIDAAVGKKNEELIMQTWARGIWLSLWSMCWEKRISAIIMCLLFKFSSRRRVPSSGRYSNYVPWTEINSRPLILKRLGNFWPEVGSLGGSDYLNVSTYLLHFFLESLIIQIYWEIRVSCWQCRHFCFQTNDWKILDILWPTQATDDKLIRHF